MHRSSTNLGTRLVTLKGVSLRPRKEEIRASLVTALHVGLSEADEPFLEACLDDRATGVRTAARHLLAELPLSHRADRMAERVRMALVVRKGSASCSAPRAIAFQIRAKTLAR